MVGVNQYASDEAAPSLPAPDYSALAAGQRQRVAEARRKRDAGAVQRALAALEAAARARGAPLMAPVLEAVRARATLGEISDVLRVVWGVYQPK